MGNSGATDSGVSARLFGTFLDLAQRSPVGRVRRLHLQRHFQAAAGVRAGRDGSTACSSWICPVPRRRAPSGTSAWTCSIWTRDQPKPNTQDWTGAEIRSCCRLAALLDVPLTESAQNVVPVAVTAAETVDRLRNWASGRCLDADRPGIYSNGQASPKRRRKIKTDPSTN